MVIAFTCPHCGQPLEMADEHGGQMAPCDRCGRLVPVPSQRFGEPSTVASLKTLKKAVWAFGFLVAVLPLLVLLLATWGRGSRSVYNVRAKPRPVRSAPAPATAVGPVTPAPPVEPPRGPQAPGASRTPAPSRGVLRPTPPVARVAPAPAPQPEAGPVEPSPEPDPSTVLVWIGATGNTYHKEGCPRLGDDAEPISLEEARSQGRKPCTRCYGE